MTYTVYTINNTLIFLIAFFSQCYGDHRDLHSFPTRRSSDLGEAGLKEEASFIVDQQAEELLSGFNRIGMILRIAEQIERHDDIRSEEHTSELQSRGHLVCRLLLEKKKTNYEDANVLPQENFI